MKINGKMLAGVLGMILFSSVGVMTLLQQQQAYAPRGCPECGPFGKLTGDFIVNVYDQTSGNPASGKFRQATATFMKNVINELRVGNPDTVPELLDIYTMEVLDIFLGGPDTIPELVADYKADVERLLLPR